MLQQRQDTYKITKILANTLNIVSLDTVDLFTVQRHESSGNRPGVNLYRLRFDNSIASSALVHASNDVAAEQVHFDLLNPKRLPFPNI